MIEQVVKTTLAQKVGGDSGFDESQEVRVNGRKQVTLGLLVSSAPAGRCSAGDRKGQSMRN
jgi:hypothetical protein